VRFSEKNKNYENYERIVRFSNRLLLEIILKKNCEVLKKLEEKFSGF
jgi:hypothetical protein